MLYYILVPTILLLPVLTDKIKNGKRFYFFVVTSLLILFAGFRHWSVGIDTPSYVNFFLNGKGITEYTFSSIFKETEFLHIIYRSIIRSLTDNYFWYLFPVACFYTIVVARFIYKHSAYPSISFLAFLSMSYYAFSMTGIRQTICYGFLIIAADALLSGKRLRAIFYIVVSAGFHATGWLFLSAVLIDLIPFGFAFLGGVFVLSAISYLKAPVFIQLFVRMLDKSEDYLEFETGSTVILLVIVTVSLAALLLHPDIFKKTSPERNMNGTLVKSTTQKDQFYIKMILFAIPILIITLYQASIFRVAAMFHFYMLALIPGVIKKQSDPYIQVLGKMIIIVTLLAELFIFTYGAAGVLPYSFSI